MTALLVLPDGREIYSGEVGKDAILSLTLTAGVNDTQELTLGSVCASMVEAELLVPEGELGLSAGEEVTLYWIDGENREKAGIFVAEKPEKTGNGTYSLTGFDRVSRLDQDVTQWLEGLQGWPYSLLDFGKLVCRHCGVELANTEIPNGDYEVAKFAARGITGRQLLFWVGEASCRFLRATPEGALFLDWYTPAEKTVSFSGENFYYQDTLTYSDYRTAPIDRVQLRFDEKDVGTIYPPEAAGNTYAVTGNYLLTAENAQSLLPVAQTLFEQLSGVAFTPCKLTVPSRLGIREGQILTVVTPAGEELTAYVMSRTASRGRDTLECTGSPTREASTAVTSQSYKALSGKILRLQTNVDGLTVENQDMAGRLTAITANVEGISARVEQTETSVSDLRENVDNQALMLTSQESRIASLELSNETISAAVEKVRTDTQTTIEGVEEAVTRLEERAELAVTAEDVSIAITERLEDGVSSVTTETGYTFNQEGMRIAKSGEEMENRLDNTGMYVTRSGEGILTANNHGVTALNLQAMQYLVAGEHAQFEDYGADRTGCFWI